MKPLTVEGKEIIPVLKTDFAFGTVVPAIVLPTFVFDLPMVWEYAKLLANTDANKIIVSDDMTAINAYFVNCLLKYFSTMILENLVNS